MGNFDFNFLEEVLDEENILSQEDFSSKFQNQFNREDFLTKIETYAEKVKLTSNTRESILEEAKQTNRYSYIASFTGDDEIVTTDLKLFGLCMLYNTEKLHIKISWQDVGFSHDIGNYAEEWILTPLSKTTSFDVTNTYYRGQGIPYSLDPVKLKMLSPIRKQSEMELDLSSKMGYLAEAARWTSKSWFTYDFHQLALLLGTVSFDFEDAKLFPFLNKTEGGCGGPPPWGNLHTAYSMIHYFNRGKSKVGILGIMKESVEIYRGNLRPKDSFFVKATHAALTSDDSWKEYRLKFETLRERGNLEPYEIQELIQLQSNSEVPIELKQKGSIVEPDNYSVGLALSRLRQEGLIMTEIDAKVYEESLIKVRAINGPTPIGLLLKKIEEDRKKFRSRALKLLSELFETSYEKGLELSKVLGEIPRKPNEDLLQILRSYYELREDKYEFLTTFNYSDQVRVFKTKDVIDFYGGTEKKEFLKDILRETFNYSSFTFLDNNFTINPEEEEKKRLIENWLQEPINNILNSPLPIGLVTDDARIIQSISNALKIQKNLSIILITADVELLNVCHLLMTKRKGHNATTLWQFHPIDFLMAIKSPPPLGLRSSIRFVNPLNKSTLTTINRKVINPILDYYKEYYPNEEVTTIIEYDFPNIERTLFHFKMEGSILLRKSGGVLTNTDLEQLDRNGRNISLLSPTQIIKGKPLPLIEESTTVFKPRGEPRVRRWNRSSRR